MTRRRAMPRYVWLLLAALAVVPPPAGARAQGVVRSTGVVLRDSAGAEYNASNPLPTTATLSGTVTIGNVTINLGGSPVATGNPFPITAASLPLPTGAATAANQTTANTSLAGINTALAGPLTVGTHAVTQSGTWRSNPDVRATAQTINSATSNAAVTVALDNGEGVVGFTITGLTASTATLTAEGSNDGGTTWSAINSVESSTLSTTLTADGNYRVNGGGRTHVRVRVSATGTGTITVAYSASSVGSLVALSTALPAGSNTIGNVSPAPSGAAANAITPVVSSVAGSSLVLKNAAGNLYSAYVTTGTTPGYLLVLNAPSDPGNGAVTPIECVVAPANQTVGVDVAGGPPDRYATGIVAVFSTTGCFTETQSATAFFKGRVQ